MSLEFNYRSARMAVAMCGKKYSWLSDSCGISEQTLAQILTGKKSPGKAVVKLLAKETGVQEADLYSGDLFSRNFRKIEKKNLIYFIEFIGSNVVKIGRSTQIKTRINALRQESSFEIKVLGTVYGEHDEESATHKRFSKSRIYGELFILSDEIKQYIAEHCEVES